jgi:hypothetical protein
MIKHLGPIVLAGIMVVTAGTTPAASTAATTTVDRSSVTPSPTTIAVRRFSRGRCRLKYRYYY